MSLHAMDWRGVTSGPDDIMTGGLYMIIMYVGERTRIPAVED